MTTNYQNSTKSAKNNSENVENNVINQNTPENIDWSGISWRERTFSHPERTLFDTPIKITNDRKETIQIYGLLYERDMRERNDLFVWSVQRYITYLMGTELLLNCVLHDIFFIISTILPVL